MNPACTDANPMVINGYEDNTEFMQKMYELGLIKLPPAAPPPPSPPPPPPQPPSPPLPRENEASPPMEGSSAEEKMIEENNEDSEPEKPVRTAQWIQRNRLLITGIFSILAVAVAIMILIIFPKINALRQPEPDEIEQETAILTDTAAPEATAPEATDPVTTGFSLTILPAETGAILTEAQTAMTTAVSMNAHQVQTISGTNSTDYTTTESTTQETVSENKSIEDRVDAVNQYIQKAIDPMTDRSTSATEQYNEFIIEKQNLRTDDNGTKCGSISKNEDHYPLYYYYSANTRGKLCVVSDDALDQTADIICYFYFEELAENEQVWIIYDNAGSITAQSMFIQSVRSDGESTICTLRTESAQSAVQENEDSAYPQFRESSVPHITTTENENEYERESEE